eukprot:m.169916 g.169916  ORF g.169916 m.169916 type:complete len:491 (+) comp15331_c0_seq8:129-1601(+)
MTMAFFLLMLHIAVAHKNVPVITWPHHECFTSEMKKFTLPSLQKLHQAQCPEEIITEIVNTKEVITAHFQEGGSPFILRASMVGNSLKRWSDCKYLKEHWPRDIPVPVLFSRKQSVQGQGMFTYQARPPRPITYNPGRFILDEDDYVQRQLYMEDVCQNWQGGLNGYTGYAQGVPIDGREGPTLSSDMKNFGWTLLDQLHKWAKWGKQKQKSKNAYLYMPAGGTAHTGSVTPLHYDRGENFVYQISGKKKFYIWSPESWASMRPLPLAHPAAQGSAIEDIWDTAENSIVVGKSCTHSSINYVEQSPRFSMDEAMFAELRVGDLLYVPRFWWHHVEADDHNGFSLSLPRARQTLPPLASGSPAHRVEVARRIERALSQVMGQAEHVPIARKMCDHLKTGKKLDTFEEGGDQWAMAYQALRYLFAGEDSGDVKFQIGNETLDDFVKWALDGRFGARQYEKDVEVPSHNTLENVVSVKEEYQLPPTSNYGPES